MTRGKTERVVVTHMSRDGNRGDLAILVATVQQIRDLLPQAEVTVLSAELAPNSHWDEADVRWTRALGVRLLGAPTPSLAAFTGGRLAWVLRLARAELAIWMVRILRHRALALLAPTDRVFFSALLDADRVIAKGGSYLHTYDANRDLLYLWRMLYPIRAARAAGQAAVPVGVSLGPFASRPAARLARRVLRRCPRIFVREEISVAAAEELGLEAELIAVIPDVALSLTPTASEDPPAKEGGPTVGFAVRPLPPRGLGPASAARARYAEALPEAARKYLRNHSTGELHLIPQSTEDIEFEQEIEQEIASDEVRLIDLDGSIDGLIAAYRELDLLVASRLHAVLLALIAGTPVLHIACEYRKSLGTMALLGLEGSAIRVEELSGPILGDLIERELDATGERPVAGLAEYRRRIRSAFELALSAGDR